MYGLTRATITLIGAAAAGLLIWLATQLSNDHVGGYWARIGLVAAAGFVMALSQLLGGWTKWGWPRLSLVVLLTAFVPVAVASLWIILAGEPGSSWFHNHVLSWTRDIHVSGLVTDLLYYIPVLAFGSGLVFGFSFDTTGPIVRDREVERTAVVERDVERTDVTDGDVDDRSAVATPTRKRRLFGRRGSDNDGDRITTRDSDEPLTADRGERTTTPEPVETGTSTTDGTVSTDTETTRTTSTTDRN